MLKSELESLMEKIKAGYMGMGDVEFYYASKLFTAAREYKDAIEEVESGRVNPDTRSAGKRQDHLR